ncbi:MAG: hypothetical protein ACRET2_05950, partial [Steroidobacteraceae bacterium]
GGSRARLDERAGARIGIAAELEPGGATRSPAGAALTSRAPHAAARPRREICFGRAEQQAAVRARIVKNPTR